MPSYLIEAAYTPAAWAGLLQNPQDARQRAQQLVEHLGGRIVNAYYAFGDYDVVAIVESPDNVAASALALTMLAGGALKALKTTPLLSVEEGLQSMRRAQEASGSYRPATGSAGAR